MKTHSLLVTAACLALLCFPAVTFAKPPCQQIPTTSCFNNLSIDTTANWSQYTFIMFGHVRSGPGNFVPNKVMRDNIARFYVDEPKFAISLGDLFYNLKDEGIETFSRWTADNVPIPFFNAIGNHDSLIGADPLPDGTRTKPGNDLKKYIREFGDPNYDFRLGSELFIFIDNGRSPVLKGKPWERVQALLAEAAQDDSLKNIFILSHKLFWSYENPAMETVFRYRHPVRTPPNYRFFFDDLKPLLEPLSKNKDIYLVSGDIGGGGRYLQTFFFQDPHITYIATGMGNTPRDSFITVKVNNGQVEMKNTNLKTGEVSRLQDYGLDYWDTFYRDNPKLAKRADQFARDK